MARDARATLGIGHHLVIPSERFFTRPLRDGDAFFDTAMGFEPLSDLVGSFQGLLILEKIYHARLFEAARGRGVFTVCVPMWEWFNGSDPAWALCDLFVCPNRHCHRVLAKLGFGNAIVLPTAMDLSVLPERQVEGPARLFVHNAGWVDWNDRKGTRDTIRAFHKMERRDVRLLVRMQNDVPLPPEARDERIEVRVGNLDHPAQLYLEGDVAVQPSKMEGIGFMVLEPVCCGLPVVTLDYGPMNEFVSQPQMRARAKPFARRAFASKWVKQAHLRLPSIRSLTRCMEWCAEHDLDGISHHNRRWAQQTFGLASLRRCWAQALESALRKYLEARPGAHTSSQPLQ
jgi:glycosyltransferase involved in cell wall biosynthesis